MRRRRQARRETPLVHVDSDAHDCKREPTVLLDLRLNQDAARFAWADQQIVRPAQVDAQPGGGANRLSRRQPGGERKQRQAVRQ